ncbi:MAG: MFS transporter [Actinomycetota bacterium]|nr:MFS transporter [Actinomycetota bacterium]
MAATDDEPARRQPNRQRPSFLLVASITITGITVNSLLTPSLPEILDGLEASRRLAGLVLAGATAPGVVLAPVIGVLADRYGRREVVVPCLVLYGVAGGLAGLSPTLTVLVALRLAQGAGSAGLINLAVVIIGDHWDGTERARLIGRNAAVLTVTLALVPPIGGTLVDLAGWRAPFALYPLALITAAAAWRGLPSTETRHETVGQQLAAAAPYLRTRAVRGVLAVGVVLFVLIFGLSLTVLPLYAEEAFGLTPSQRGLLLALPAVTSTVAALLLGRLHQRFVGRRVIVAGAALFPVAYAGVAWAPSLPYLVGAVLVVGAGEGLLIPGLQDLATSVAPAASRGTVVALWVSAARLGQTIGPVVSGYAAGTVGSPATFAVGAAVAATMPFALAAALQPRREAVG